MFYCGIDIAKNNHEASIIDERGKRLIESISFSNSQKGCEKLFKLFEKFEINPGNIVVGMEATGHYWLSVYSFFIENQIEDLETQISDLLSKTNQVITTIPGIGTTLGAIIVSEIGDIYRFDSPSKLVAFAGLDVKVNQSGEFSGTKNKISKRGSPYLRRAIWLAANRAAFCDPILSDYYQSLKSHGKHHLTAIGAISRKLCNIIFVILRENRPYQINPPLNQNL